MTTTRPAANRDDALLAELGLTPSLGNILAGLDLTNLSPARQPVYTTARVHNLLVTSAGLGGRQTAVPHPGLVDAPLLAAVAGVDGTAEAVAPFDVAFTSNADETDEGDPLPESSLVYTAGDLRIMPTIGHTIPITKQALSHNANLRADVDAFLSGGLIVKLEQRIADELAATSGLVAHPYDTDLATTIRTGIAVAAKSMRELGPGVVTVALSPDDHARLDLSGHRLAQWPAVIVSSPALPSGVAYIGRLRLAAQMFATKVQVTVGYVDDQFIRGKVTARATVSALAHITAPGAIVRCALS